MKGIQLLSDLEIVLKASRVSKDSRINRSFLHSRMCTYAGEEMRQSFRRNGYINPQWINDYGAVDVAEISSSEIPGLIKSGITLGKFRIPAVVALDDNRGIHSVYGDISGNEYYQISESEFRQKLRADKNLITKFFNYFFAQGQNVYVYPYIRNLRVKLIPVNPMEGYIIQTHKPVSGELVPASEWTLGEEYIVTAGTINHNGTIYSAGQSFIAQSPNYTGNGILEFKNKKRHLTLEDEYPITTDIFEAISMKIWMKDFQLERNEIADIKNDGADQTQLNAQ